MNTAIRLIPIYAFLVLSMGFEVQAANEEGWYFTPMLSYIKADSDRDADDDFGLMLGFGKQMNEDWNLELGAVMDNLDFEDSSDEYEQFGLIADGIYFFDRESEWQTYGVVGAGIMSTDAGSRDSTNPMINFGVGISRALNERGMKFRADLRYRIDMDDESISSEDEFSDLLLNVGLTIPLGAESKANPQPQPEPEVQETTAPVKQDSDADGVMDSADNCPDTKSGAEVNNRGCEIVAVDSDNDGIEDGKDQCPNSKPGIMVDITGCELQQSFVLEGVNFESNSDALTEASVSVLNQVAETLKKNRDVNVEVAGYTDDRGAEEYNRALSQKRAESVKTYLRSAGVNAARMTAKGYGEESPIADNSTSAGRAQNRRVELHIM